MSAVVVAMRPKARRHIIQRGFKAGKVRLLGQVAHGGVGLTISRVEGVKIETNLLTARTAKRETYMIEVADVFAVALEGTTNGPVRRAGFG